MACLYVRVEVVQGRSIELIVVAHPCRRISKKVSNYRAIIDNYNRSIDELSSGNCWKGYLESLIECFVEIERLADVI